MNLGILLLFVHLLVDLGIAAKISSTKCEKSLTTVSGTKSTIAHNCPGDLIFEDTFDSLDFDVWEHENTLADGGNWEFQWYRNNRSNSFVEEGNLYIRPTLTADDHGETFLSTGSVNLHGRSPVEHCTDPSFEGCDRTATPQYILNPIKSAKIHTFNSFAFKYGKVEVSARMPSGDWLWPAVWFMPKHNAYGAWPSSGEINLVDSRGNRDLLKNKINIGVEQIRSSLHFGPYSALDGVNTATYLRNSDSGKGFNSGFHRYQMEWTPEKITFSVDDIETGTVTAGPGFWAKGNFENSAPVTDNPWKSGSKMAPFDQEFYIVINLAVGGNNNFPDEAQNPGEKPWRNGSLTGATEFWNGRNVWLPTWKLKENKSKEASLLVDYVRVWAL